MLRTDISRIGFTWAVGMALALLTAQDVSAQDDAPGETAPLATITEFDLIPNTAERVARTFRYEFGLSDVSDFEVVDDVFEANPDDALWKHTFALKLSALFTTPAEMSSAWQTVADNRHPSTGLGPTNGNELLDVLGRGRKRDHMARFLSAFSLSASLGKRATFETFGLIQPANPDDTSQWTYDVTFDSSVLFRGPADRKAAYEATTAYLKAYPEAADGLAIDDPCVGRTSPKACIGRLAGLSGGRAYWASLIPSAKLETIDQFDYATVGGQPILFPESFKEGALQTLSLTWDLQKLLTGADLRTEAVSAYKAARDLIETIERSKANLAVQPIVLTRGAYHALPLVAQSAATLANATGVTWKRNENGTWIDGLYLTGDGMLIGVPSCTARETGLALTLTYGKDRQEEVAVSWAPDSNACPALGASPTGGSEFVGGARWPDR